MVRDNQARPQEGREVERTALERCADADAYTGWSSPWPLLCPWYGEIGWGVDTEDVEILSLNDRSRLYYLAAFARQAALACPGPLAECGVYRGGSALAIAQATQVSPRKLYLLDSFQGLSVPGVGKDIAYAAGEFAFRDRVAVEAILAPYDVEVIEGWMPSSFEELPDVAWAFVHVDLDLYDPTRAACEYFYTRVAPGGVMLFDEYGFPSCRGERTAVDEFFRSKTESPVVLPTGQAIVVRSPE